MMVTQLLLTLLLAALAAAAAVSVPGPPPSPCDFNVMCLCTRSAVTLAVRDVRCVGVPFGMMPALPPGPLGFVELVNSGLERIDEDSFEGTRVETLRLMRNRITWIDPGAFRPLAETLTSVDIQFNRLNSLPAELFRSMANVTMIDLHGNFLHELRPADWRWLRRSLGQVFLGDNDLCRLEPGTFAAFGRLVSLDLNDNLLTELPAAALPDDLQMLTVNNNLLQELPMPALRKLQRLNWLHFSGNYITKLPSESLGPSRRMVELHLSHNLLQELPGRLFNGSVRLHDLHLQYNGLTSLRLAAFAGLHLARLFLAHNRISWVDPDAFHGIAHSLITLDLEGNQLLEVPTALRVLKELRFLALSHNAITEVPAGALQEFQAALELLSLAGNMLEAVPAAALRGCSQLMILNLGNNRIQNISDQDFVGWGGRLERLLLSNNLLTKLPDRLFHAAPSLHELSLSFNQLWQFSAESLADLADSLMSLEVSFALRAPEFPRELVKPLKALRSLVMDNNQFVGIADTALYGLGELEYVNLESNRLRRLPPTLFHRSVHKQLREVRLCYNRLERLERHTFSGLPSLQTVVLGGNAIGAVENLAFNELQKLFTVILESNQLADVAAHAFHGLPNLVHLDLQNNKLRDFSLKCFFNVSNELVPLALNLSHNQINAMYPYPTGSPMHVKTLDLSHNRLPEVPTNFLEGVSLALRHLDLSFNEIERLDDTTFGRLDALQVLKLRGNRISRLRPRAFASVPHLQILDLSHNAVTRLPAGLLHNQWTLRHLTLAHNQLEGLPVELLHRAPLESLDLSHNVLRSVPAAALAAAGASLARLDLTANRLEQLDGVMFARLPRLTRLRLAHNRLSVLRDTVFLSLPRLLSLDLSFNPLRTNYKELFHYLQPLQELNLAAVGLQRAPDLPLPNLAHLNVSGNEMTQIPFGAFAMMKNLRVLDLSRNSFSAVPSETWMHTPLLRTLDISGNPIQILNGESFSGLQHVRDLNLGELYQLVRFDTDTLLRMRELDTLRITTCPQIEKYRFRLGGVLNSLQSVRYLHVEVRETKLEDQLLRGFGPKLRELRLSGQNLRHIEPDAFEGVQSRVGLVLQLRDTSVSELPDDLLRHLRHVTALTLDLRGNRLINMSPSTLYQNGTAWEAVGTEVVKGGIALGENRWVCDCALTWLGQWQRRWVRESLRLHTATPRDAQIMQKGVRQATCTDLRTGAETPIIELRAEDLHCKIGAVGAAARPAPAVGLLLLVLGARLALGARPVLGAHPPDVT